MSSSDPKSKILARRARFIAAAVTSAGLASCSQAAVCLEMAAPDATADGGVVSDTKPQPCLEPVEDSSFNDVAPEVCLSPVLDSGAEVKGDATTDTAVEDTTPVPCLTAPLDTGIAEDTAPMPCLSPPPPPSDGG